MSSTRVVLVLAALAGLTACAAPTYEHAAGLGITPIEQFPLSTTLAPEGIQLTPHSYGLSQNQASALNDIAAGWRASREGDVLIEAPAAGSDDAAATAYAARDALERFGVPAASIKLSGYAGDGSSAPPIRVSFLTRQAKIDECGRSWSDLTHTGENQPHAQFGCAVNANLAVMIADPADIDRPRTNDPVDAGRRQVVIDRYRAGAKTSAETDEKADGTVSRVVN